MFCLCSCVRMKRDPDLLREILLVIEASPSAELLQLPAFNDHAPPAVRFHVRLLIEARLVHAIPGVQRADPNWFALRLSWQGYDYLEIIRDPRIWRLTKKAATKTGRSEEHTSELQSLMRISYADFCLIKKKKHKN